MVRTVENLLYLLRRWVVCLRGLLIRFGGHPKGSGQSIFSPLLETMQLPFSDEYKIIQTVLKLFGLFHSDYV